MRDVDVAKTFSTVARDWFRDLDTEYEQVD